METMLKWIEILDHAARILMYALPLGGLALLAVRVGIYFMDRKTGDVKKLKRSVLIAAILAAVACVISAGLYWWLS